MQIQAVQESPTLISPDLGSLTVLIADDEDIICKTLALYLHHLGIDRIQTTSDGALALEEMDQGHYDYLFVDLMMPEMDGMEVLKRVTRDHHLTSVIIMTGYPSMDVVIDAMHHGASDFLVKPFRFEEVKLSLERIQRLHFLMEKNWRLREELEKKREVEELNKQLERRIRLQTILYQIVDALSKINRSENLYRYVITKAIESCNAKKACFMIYDQGNSHLLALAQQGFRKLRPGIHAPFLCDPDGRTLLDREFTKTYFGKSATGEIPLDRTFRHNGFISTPFNIRNEPFGVLFVSEKQGEKSFDAEDEFILKFLAEKAALNIENMALYDNLRESLMATLMALVSAIEAKDAYTQQHSSRVTEYALKIALAMGLAKNDLERIKTSGPVHDIGKIGIRDCILNKPDRLTDDEFDHIKSHPLIGVNIVSPLGLDQEELAIIRNHHERWDGSGYPDGYTGRGIPRLARVLAVADAFDAMTSDRAYRRALPFSVCLAELRKNSGSQFDPEVVGAALSVLVSQA